MRLTQKQAEPFFAYARERYAIMRRRCAGQPAPWTLDPILRQYRFCNVFREDDRTTRWFRDNIRGPARYEREVLAATVLFRWFNRITTGEVMLEAGILNRESFSFNRFEKLLRERYPKGPYVTAAYMVKTPAGLDKITGLLKCAREVMRDADKIVCQLGHKPTLQQAHELLVAYPFVGPFMAYEWVTDLYHTDLLRDASDAMTWASAGPGAARGACRVAGYPLGSVRYAVPAGQAELLGIMRALLLWEGELWPSDWPHWDMRTVEHTLCEFDKYERARLGEGRPKQLYRPHLEQK